MPPKKDKVDAFNHKVMLKKYGVSESWVEIQALLLTSQAPLNRQVNAPKFQFPHL